VKLIIAGSRKIVVPTMKIVEILISKGFNRNMFTEVVSGGASGVDASGEAFAKEFNIPIKVFKPDWDKYGKSAGPKRNRQMALYGDFLLLIWNRDSPGSKNMLQEAKNAGIGSIEVMWDKYLRGNS
jgi:hypothetical protein